jgi:hypothetical protein
MEVQKATGTVPGIHVIEIPTVATPKPKGLPTTPFSLLKC